MLREIYEQPQCIQETIERNIEGDLIFPGAFQPIENALPAFRKSSSRPAAPGNAGLAGEIMIEDLAGAAVDVEYSSEYCCRSTHAGADPIIVVITQSGETADTFAAQREALNRGAKSIAISNVADSTIAREASAVLHTYAGEKKAVPATKSFTAQLSILYLLALFLARQRGRMTSEVTRTHLRQLAAIPKGIEKSLGDWDAQMADCAKMFHKSHAFLFLGRGVHYAIAREGALKLNESSYVQANGLPTGELRHGPNALVDEKLLVMVLATQDASDPDSVLRYQKTLGVLEYIKSRGGKTIAISTEGDREAAEIADRTIFVHAAPRTAAADCRGGAPAAFRVPLRRSQRVQRGSPAQPGKVRGKRLNLNLQPARG